MTVTAKVKQNKPPSQLYGLFIILFQFSFYYMIPTDCFLELAKS